MLRRPPVRGVVAAAVLAKLAAGYDLSPRWGHAVAFLPDPPTLVIQGGKTNIDGAYTYTSAPNSNETVIIPLGTAFSASSPPAGQVLSASPPGPDYAWHCMAPLGQDDGTWHLMTIGGDGGWESQSDTSADSAWLANLNPTTGAVSYTHEPTGWANQPSRRIYHGCAAPVHGGNVFVTGGLTDDGSGTTYNNTYMFNTTSERFTPLPSMPVSLYHHATVLLGNGTLLNLGGVYMSPDTGSPALQPLDRVFSLPTNSSDPAWGTVGINGPAPAPRRGASATLNPDGTVFVFGGADVNFSTVYSDGWILDPNNLSWTQVITPGQGPGPRFDHTAIDVGGGQIIIFGGFGPNVAADTNIHLVTVSSTSAAAAPSYTPVPIPTTGYGVPGGGDGNGNGVGGGSANGGQGGSNSNGNGSSGSDGNGGGSDNKGGSTSNPNGGSGATASGGNGNGNGDGSGHPGPSPTGHVGKEQSNSGLTTARLAGLIAGLGAAVLLGVILLLFARHRYKRRHATGRGDNRAYSEKGSRGLLGDSETPLSPPPPTLPPGFDTPSRRKDALAALGVGVAAVGAAAVAAGRKVSGKDQPQGYTALAPAPPTARDEDADNDSDLGGGLVGMFRRSTRRLGRGIRLIGVTRSIDDEDDDELPPLQPTIYRQRSRHAMLQDEDSRRFSIEQQRRAVGSIPEENDKDWILESPDRSNWRDAESLLSDNHLSAPPMRGGPVPTPPMGSPNLSIFDAFQAPTPSVYDAFQAPHSAAPSLYAAFQAPQSSTTGRSLGTSGVNSAAIFGGAAAATAAAAVTASAVMAHNSFNPSHDSLSPDDAISSRRVTLEPGASPTSRRHPIDTGDTLMLHPNRYSTQSIPLSAASSNSHSLADINEATISNAQILNQPSATASLLSRNPSLMSRGASVYFESPPESPRSIRPIQNPVLRQVSLLRRISSGIMGRGRGEMPSSSLGSSHLSASHPTSSVYVRDPAPQPSDWPLALQAQNSLSSHEDSDEWNRNTESFYPLPLGTRQRPSITEVGSIRSVGDVCVMQRELSLSSAEAHIERLDTPDFSGLGSRSSVVSPVTAGPGDRGDIGLRHPSVVLRPTNPGPTPSGSTLGSLSRESSPSPPPQDHLMPSLFVDARSTPTSPIGGMHSEAARRVSGDGFLTPLTTATSHSSDSHDSGKSLPSPSLAWGAQASPRNSPRNSTAGLPTSPGRAPASPRLLPGGPRPALTVNTTGNAPLMPSPLSPSRTGVSEASSRSSGHSAQTAQPRAAGSVTSTSEISLPASSTTATPTRNLLLAASGRYTPLLTPSPQRGSPNRRAVQDMVASINRRGASVPSLFASTNRSASGSPVNASSPARTYELARRDPLTVTNPDASRLSFDDGAERN